MDVCEPEVGEDGDEKALGGSEKGEDENYVAQLHQVFLSCDTSGCGFLRRAELIELCSQLHLEDQTGLIVRHLLGDQPDAKVDFDDFKEKFVCLLSESADEVEGVLRPGAEDPLTQEDRLLSTSARRKNLFQSPEREVSPRYVWGSKKYGRRSRPESDVLDANYLLNSDFLEPEEVFLFDSNDDGLSSGAEGGGGGGVAEEEEEEQSLGAVRRRSSWAHSPVTPAPRQGAKRRRRMRSSEDRSSLDSDNQDCVKWSACEVGMGQPTGAPNDEEYLQSIWLKLGVGADGFLNKDGLIRVCEHIGMEKLSEEVISQLFEKLDVDQDGQISFDEFFHLFRNGEAHHTASPTVVCEVKNVLGECPRGGSTMDPSGPGSDMGLFHVLAPQCSRPGYVEPEAIVELWDSLGITSSYAIFRHLGMSSVSPVNLMMLSSLLEESLQTGMRMSPRETEVCHAALATFNQEIKYLQKSVEQLNTEREKLRGDVAEANSRATLMAQEVDDHQLKLETSSQLKIMNMEKKFQEQLRLLQEELESEREAFNKQLALNKRNSGEEMTSLKESELRLREQLNLAQNENQILEEELMEVSQRLSEAQRMNQSHQKEAESLLAYNTEVSYEEQLRLMLAELETVRLENKQLKDQNDELSTQLQEAMHCSRSRGVSEEDAQGEEEQGHRRNGSWLADYMKEQGPRRRGSGPLSLTESDTLTTSNPSLDAVSEGGSRGLGLVRENSGPSHSRLATSAFALACMSDEDEYLELNRPLVAPSMGEQVDNVILCAFANKMKLKKVFSVLKQRFVEMHLEETQRRPELRRSDALCPTDEEDEEEESQGVGADSGVDTPTPHWRRAVEEEVRGEQELALKIAMLKSEVYWREEVERERSEGERERSALLDKVLSLEFQLANAMKMLRERDHCGGRRGTEKEQRKEPEDELRAFGFLGRSRSWKEGGKAGGGWSNTERRRRRWLRSKNNLEALDIESDTRSRRSSQNSADDEDEEYQESKKSFHHDIKCRVQRKSNPSLFDKLMLERDTGSTAPAKTNCVIDMNVLHSINQHLNQQEKRNQQLETTLKERTLHTERLINETKKRYEDEIERVSQLVHRTRSFLKEQTLKVKGQSEKLFESENTIKELSWENSELVKLLQISEEKRLKSEKMNYGLKQKCDALNQLVSDMYRIKTT